MPPATTSTTKPASTSNVGSPSITPMKATAMADAEASGAVPGRSASAAGRARPPATARTNAMIVSLVDDDEVRQVAPDPTRR